MTAAPIGKTLRAVAFSALALFSATRIGASPVGEAAPSREPVTLSATLEPETVFPGHPFVFLVSRTAAPEALQAVLVSPSGRTALRSRLVPLGTNEFGQEALAAFLAVPSTLGTGTAKVQARSSSGEVVAEKELTILPKDFLREEIPLDLENTTIRTEPDPQKIAEAEELYRLIGTIDPAALWATGPFLLPVEDAPRTSAFGDRRVYRYVTGETESSIHAGIDFGVPLGTLVLSCARGKVVLAKDRIVTGKSVVIEHLPGVFSAYYHLSRIDVSPGDVVAAGSAIGASGTTGLSTGPHLHWEIRVSGEAADPDVFTVWRVLDKNLLISRIIQPSASN